MTKEQLDAMLGAMSAEERELAIAADDAYDRLYAHRLSNAYGVEVVCNPGGDRTKIQIDGVVMDGEQFSKWLEEKEAEYVVLNKKSHSADGTTLNSESVLKLSRATILEWLEEHEEAYNDYLMYFNNYGKEPSAEDIVSWISDHETLTEDFENHFDVVVDDYDEDDDWDEDDWDDEEEEEDEDSESTTEELPSEVRISYEEVDPYEECYTTSISDVSTKAIKNYLRKTYGHCLARGAAPVIEIDLICEEVIVSNIEWGRKLTASELASIYRY